MAHNLQDAGTNGVGDTGPAPIDNGAFTPRRRNLMLIALMFVGVCSMLDRSIVAVVLEPIKHEYRLTDGQLGLLSLAFALAHAAVVVPFGALADRVNRRNLISAALFVWSLATLFCGAAHTFVQLLLLRMGVGGGEAAGQPATMSSVSDMFPPERRSTAISIYFLGAPIATLMAGGVGGVIAGVYGWRSAMAAAAVPGFILCLVLFLFRDVPRERPASDPMTAVAAPRLPDVLKFVAGQRALLHVIAAVGVITLVISGPGAFAYSFFIRYHHMKLQTLGPLLGGLSAIIGLVVIPGSGFLSDYLGKDDPGRRLLAVAGVLVLATPTVLASYVTPKPFALGLFLATLLIQGVWLGPLHSTAQSLCPSQMRSTVAAMLFVVNGLIGVGLGPVLVGELSDVFAAHFHGDGLRPALMIVTALGLWGALHLYLATRTLQRDLERARHFHSLP